MALLAIVGSDIARTKRLHVIACLVSLQFLKYIIRPVTQPLSKKGQEKSCQTLAFGSDHVGLVETAFMRLSTDNAILAIPFLPLLINLVRLPPEAASWRLLWLRWDNFYVPQCP
jgi:hypothetical protein